MEPPWLPKLHKTYPEALAPIDAKLESLNDQLEWLEKRITKAKVEIDMSDDQKRLAEVQVEGQAK
jgi:hypothetical protein